MNTSTSSNSSRHHRYPAPPEESNGIDGSSSSIGGVQDEERNIETTLLLPRRQSYIESETRPSLLVENPSEIPYNDPSSPYYNRRRLWTEMPPHYDTMATVTLTHMDTISNHEPSSTLLSQPYHDEAIAVYSFSPYHDFISQRFSFNLSSSSPHDDRDDTLFILGNTSETSLSDLEGGRAGGGTNIPAIRSNGQDTTNNTITNPTTDNNNNNTTAGADDPASPTTDYVMDTVNRLRCIFSCVTLPIVPIGSVLSMTLFYVIYAALVLDVHRDCSHPLKLYTLYSTALFLYIPQHKNVKNFLFRYNREQDGVQHAPIGLRVYDQCFYLLCLIYLSTGIDLCQSCMEDLVKVPPPEVDFTTSSSSSSISTQGDSLLQTHNYNKTQSGGISSCAVTCPHLYSATKLYVIVLQLFAFAMLLPIVFLPCIYAYVVRRVHRGVESIFLHSILQRGNNGTGHFMDSTDNDNDGVTVQEIMDTLQQVQLIFVKDSTTSTKETDPLLAKKVQILLNKSKSSTEESDDSIKKKGKIKDWEHVKDCCICMSELTVSSEDLPSPRQDCTLHDTRIIDTSTTFSILSPLLPPSLDHDELVDGYQQQQQQNGNYNFTRGSISNDIIVQTKCGHVFHKACIGGWIGGTWEDSNTSSATNTSVQARRARRRCCPLCREDLAPLRSQS